MKLYSLKQTYNYGAKDNGLRRARREMEGGETLPLTNSLGVVSGGTLATSASSPNMEDGGGGVCDGPEPKRRSKR